jgi:hypothetical protein
MPTFSKVNTKRIQRKLFRTRGALIVGAVAFVFLVGIVVGFKNCWEL